MSHCFPMVWSGGRAQRLGGGAACSTGVCSTHHEGVCSATGDRSNEDAEIFCSQNPSGRDRFRDCSCERAARFPAFLAAVAANSQYSCPGTSMTGFFPGKGKTYGRVTFFFTRFLRDESLDKTMQKFPHRISIATRPIFEFQNMYPQVRY